MISKTFHTYEKGLDGQKPGTNGCFCRLILLAPVGPGLWGNYLVQTQTRQNAAFVRNRKYRDYFLSQ
jgi:hypothetical protein